MDVWTSQRPGAGGPTRHQRGQGNSRDDEVNLLSRGANYGWDPIPGYDESTPMTDLTKFPSAKVAKWSSGNPTIATSGGTFLSGSAWGSWEGGHGDRSAEGQRDPVAAPQPGRQRLECGEHRGRAELRADPYRAAGSGWCALLHHLKGSNDIIGKITPTAKPPAYHLGLDVSPVGVSAVRTGSDIYAFVRSTGDKFMYRRSTDDGRTWGGWTDAGVTSTSARGCRRRRPGGLTCSPGTSAGQVIHTWHVNGVRKGQKNLGGGINAAPAASSVGEGTLDVFVRSPGGHAYRNHFNKTTWSGWQSLGGIFASAFSASANTSTRSRR